MLGADMEQTAWRLFCVVTGLYLTAFGTYAVVTRRMPRGIAGLSGNPSPWYGAPAVAAGIGFLVGAALCFWAAAR
jgi:hypothetical protein